jgi:ParB/RepB/Spo0J family partition protein
VVRAIKTGGYLSDLGPLGYQMADGWLRFKGFAYLVAQGHPEYETMPVIVRELTDQQMADMVLEANTVRKDMTPIDMAKLFKKYIEDFGVTHAELAEKHHCSAGEIGNTIRLLDLPADIQEKIVSQEISETQGRQLLRVSNAPELQKKMLDYCVQRHPTVNELSDSINDNLWNVTKSLNPGSPGKPSFDVAGCKDCEFKTQAADRWGGGKKEDRCLKVSCWEEKNAAVLQAKLKEAAASFKAAGIEQKIFTSEELDYNHRESIRNSDIDNPEECKTCLKKAFFKYRINDADKPEIVCTDPACYRKKKTKKTKDENKVRRDADQKLTEELTRFFQEAAANPRGSLEVIVRHALPGLSADGCLDLVKSFKLPTEKNGRLDRDKFKEWLRARSVDELLDLAVAIFMIRERRQYSGEISDKLTPGLTEDMAIIRNKDGKPDIAQIPAGVRLAYKVPHEECEKCELSTKDHTIGLKFRTSSGAYNPVCLKDYVKVTGSVPALPTMFAEQ